MNTKALAFVLAVAAAPYPALGETPAQLPAGAAPLTFHGSRLYYGIGAGHQLPPDYSVLNVSGMPVFRANDLCYYRVVPPPHASWYYAASRCAEGRSVLSATPPQLR